MELSLLEQMIEQDFGYKTQGSHWGRAIAHDSLTVDREKDVFYFNSEGIAGDAYIYLIKVRKLPPQDAKEFLKHKSFIGTFIHEVKNGGETIVYPKLVDVFHAALQQEDKTYFYRRTITDETISRFKLGYDSGFYTIPIYQDGVFKQFQLRRDNPKTIRNYYSGVGPLLFNSDIMKITNKIFITEGVTSCIVMSQNGIPCVSFNSGAEGFIPEWLHYFTHQREIYLLFDNDDAGRKGAVRTAKILGEMRCKIYTFWDHEEKGYDANDYFIDGNSKEMLLDNVYANSKYCFELAEYRKLPIDKRKRAW